MAITWLDVGSGVSLSADKLTVTKTTGLPWAIRSTRASVGVTSGKWYWEVKVSTTGTSSGRMGVGVCNYSHDLSIGIGYNTQSIGWLNPNNLVYNSTSTTYGNAMKSGDIIGVAIDLDDANGKLEYFKNGVSQGIAENNLKSKITGAIYPALLVYSELEVLTTKFAQPFIYSIPTGYKAYDTPWYDGRVKTKVSDMQIGDVIPCRYTALTSGQPGYFSELGTCTAQEIPVTGTPTPDGLFYFIMVGYDSRGRKKLIADRNIQNTISWDALNTGGICSGKELIFSSKLNNEHQPHVVQSGTLYADPYISYQTAPLSSAPYLSDSSTVEKNHTPCLSGTVNNTGFISVDIGTARVVTKLVLKNMTENTDGQDYNTMYVKNFILQGSNQTGNNSDSWEDICRGLTNNGAIGAVDTFSFSNTKSYRFYRIFFIDNWGYANFRAISEMELYSSSETNMFPDNNLELRLLTGGLSGSDSYNEWDKIIAGSNLGGAITPGDSNVWHWSGIYSWTSTTDTTGTNASRAVRGSSVATGRGVNFPSSSVLASAGFRPVLLVGGLSSEIIKYLLQLELNIYKLNSTIPNILDDLPILKTLTEGQTCKDILSSSDINSYGCDKLDIVLQAKDLFPKGSKYKILKFKSN